MSEIHYTPAERIILACLAHGEVVPAAQVCAHLWGGDHARWPDSNVLQVLISRIRRKIGKDRIHTIHGIGYRLVSP